MPAGDSMKWQYSGSNRKIFFNAPLAQSCSVGPLIDYKEEKVTEDRGAL